MKSDLTEYIFGYTTRSTVRDGHKQGLDNKDSIEIGGGDRCTTNGASGKRGIFAPTQVSNSNGTAWGERGGFFSDSLSVHAGSLLDNRSDYLC
ncbi:hypothetical protein WN943_026578 [Citrus x changshan-huyou]